MPALPAAPQRATFATSYRRTLVLAAVLGVAALVVLSVLGYPAVGALLCVGLGLGAWNSSRVQASYPQVLADGELDRRAMTSSTFRRLGAVTFAVVLLAVAFRPVGWSSVLGLAAFQVLLVANTAGPLLREVRRG